MSGIRAAFFDRDGTLLTRDPAFARAQTALIERFTGRPYTRDPALTQRVFAEADKVKTLSDERAFWLHYYEEVLRAEGVSAALHEKSEELLRFSWCRGSMLFPETRETLARLAARGVRMGVISDTFPSLKRTLEEAGIARFFECFINSSEVGVMKPDPRIYEAALDALGVSAEQSLYVDDYDVEADGARALGFTAYHIVRGGNENGPWEINSLIQMTEGLQKE